MHARTLVAALAALAVAGCAGESNSARGTPSRPALDPEAPMTGTVRVAYLHHSTGGVVWGGGVAGQIQSWNSGHGTDYRITEVTYPATSGGYPWSNYAYDYWNLWVSHTGASRDRGELNLDDLAAAYDVIVWKHCYPGSNIDPDDVPTDVTSSQQTLRNYREQYARLKDRMRAFPGLRFVVWTQPALLAIHTNAGEAGRAREFARWVKEDWDVPGDNIYVWDFRALEADADGLYLPTANAASPTDSHPNATLGASAAPGIARRIIDVIEGRGDTGSRTGL